MLTRTPLLKLCIRLPLLLAVGLAACVGGQSGMEDSFMTMGLPPCPCALADHAVVVRGRLESLDACSARVMVTDILAGAGHAQVVPGDLIEGRPLACNTEPPEVSSEVLAVFAPGSPSLISVYAWGEAFVVEPVIAGAQPVAVSELGVLADERACMAHVYGESWLGPREVLPEPEPGEPGLPGAGGPITLSPQATAALPTSMLDPAGSTLSDGCQVQSPPLIEDEDDAAGIVEPAEPDATAASGPAP